MRGVSTNENVRVDSNSLDACTMYYDRISKDRLFFRFVRRGDAYSTSGGWWMAPFCFFSKKGSLTRLCILFEQN